LQQKDLYTVEDYFISFRGGEQWGFAYFFNTYSERLIHFAFSYLKNKEAAEDVVEDSFIKLWNKREEIENASAIKSYLYSTTRNACIDQIRKAAVEQKHAKQIKQLTSPLVEDVSHRIIAAETSNMLFATLNNLPEECCQVFKMYYLEKKELKEIAAELKLSLSTIKNRKAQAIELLRAELPRMGFILLLLLHHTI
jgi:RNA polymerase sigma-70 factor, ECF subfamily